LLIRDMASAQPPSGIAPFPANRSLLCHWNDR
jgi:hypothetical protein